MVMTDVSGRKERADVLGKLGVAYGIGMMVGPSIGGESVHLLLLEPPCSVCRPCDYHV